MKDYFKVLLSSRVARLCVALAIGAAVVWAIVGLRHSAKQSFVIAAIDRGDIVRSVSSSGAVSAVVTVTVGSQVSGNLTQVLVDFNAKVRKGQLLAVIEPTIIEAQVRSAQADELVQTTTIRSAVAQANAARTTLEKAKRDYNRARSLHDQKLLSDIDLDAARSSAEIDQNSLEVAQANLENARSQLVRVRSNLLQARTNLQHTKIVSPVDGVVISRSVDPGQTVQAAMTAPELFKIAQDLSRIRIETKVDEADIGSIKEGARAEFSVDAYPDRTFAGQVNQVRINGTTTANVVTYSVMVQADNPEQILLPGMTANVKIITSERTGVLRVPSAALRFRPPDASTGADAALFDSGNSVRRGTTGGPMAGGTGGGPGPGSGSGGGQTKRVVARRLVELTPEIMTTLGMDATRQRKATEALNDLASRVAADAKSSSNTNPLGGGMSNFRAVFGGINDAQLNRQRLVNALAEVLSPEQMKAYLALDAASTVRSATLYVPDASGKPVARKVRVGLADDSNTELVAGLASGDKVIVRAVVSGQPK
jgi:HlyD family secretion protein